MPFIDVPDGAGANLERAFAIRPDVYAALGRPCAMSRGHGLARIALLAVKNLAKERTGAPMGRSRHDCLRTKLDFLALDSHKPLQSIKRILRVGIIHRLLATKSLSAKSKR